MKKPLFIVLTSVPLIIIGLISLSNNDITPQKIIKKEISHSKSQVIKKKQTAASPQKTTFPTFHKRPKQENGEDITDLMDLMDIVDRNYKSLCSEIERVKEDITIIEEQKMAYIKTFPADATMEQIDEGLKDYDNEIEYLRLIEITCSRRS